MNRIAPLGQTGKVVNNLAASLSFETIQGTVIHHVARAYWLEHSQNRIDLACGGKATLVIGMMEKSYEWTAYDNPNEFPFQQQRFRSGMTMPQAPSHSIPFGQPLRVTVSLITADTGRTVEVINLLLEVSEDGKRVQVGSYR